MENITTIRKGLEVRGWSDRIQANFAIVGEQHHASIGHDVRNTGKQLLGAQLPRPQHFLVVRA